MIEIHITDDHSKEVINEKDKAVLRALEAIGIKAEGYAQLKCPVDTGLLRNSITHAVAGSSPALSNYKANTTHATTEATKRAGTAGKAVSPPRAGAYAGTLPGGEAAVYIGTNVEYAPYVEYGSRGRVAQPFLHPAVENHADEYKTMVEHYLNGNF